MVTRLMVALFTSVAVAIGLDVKLQGQEPPLNQQAQPAPAADLPPVPKGIEVLARGPVHEAFATPTTDPVPTQPIPKKPPKTIEEMPPDQKPQGDVNWISGYWAWDDDRKDFLWVSGIWRTSPPGKQWVAGYWKEAGDQWQWVPGFWTTVAQESAKQDITYLPAPPAPPEVAGPGEPPEANSFYVPGAWSWTGDHYGWRAGYWAHVQPGYVWVPAHYRWTPGGYIYISGYWDLAVSRRGVLFAPVVVDPFLVGPGFVYTPAYVVSDSLLVDAMFVRPCYCHYYFGDYYGPAYRTLGFESCIVYGRYHYDSIVVYSYWEHRAEPRWGAIQLDICLARHAGQAPCPPRTLIQQNITNVNIVNNNTTNITNTTVNNPPAIVPASQLAAAKGINTVPLNPATRMQMSKQAQVVQQVAVQRSQSELPVAAGASAQPRVASYNFPPSSPATAAAAPRNNASSMPANVHASTGSSNAPPAPSSLSGPNATKFGPMAPTTRPGATPPSRWPFRSPMPLRRPTAPPPPQGNHPPGNNGNPHSN